MTGSTANGNGAGSRARTAIPPGFDATLVIGDARRLALVPERLALDAETFSALATVAAVSLGAPRGMVTLVTAEEQQVLGSHGYDGPAADPVDETICAYTVALGEPLLLGDLRCDRVPGLPAEIVRRLKAYAGVPLRLAGERVGTICVTDDRPRAWTLQDAERLQALADIGSHMLARSP